MYSSLVRTVRTASSERFLVRRDATDCAVLDLHYPAPGRAIGTLILLEGAGLTTDDVPDLLTRIDTDLLPDVSFEDGTLEYSVVVGRAVGTFVKAAE